jgi:hypothetical protein
VRSPLLRVIEEQFDVAAQVIDAVGGDVCTVLGLGKNERALKDGLRVEGEAPGGPGRLDAVLVDRRPYIRFDLRDVAGDRACAGIANRRIAVVRFLHHRAGQAGEPGKRALQNRLAEVDVAEHPGERIGVTVVGRRCEQAARHLRPVVSGGDSHVVLAGEMMEERALGHAGGGAKVIDRRCRVTLRPDDRHSGVEDSVLGRRFRDVHR